MKLNILNIYTRFICVKIFTFDYCTHNENLSDKCVYVENIFEKYCFSKQF